MVIRVVTYNIFLNQARWEKRRDLIVKELDILDADVICLQEVVLPRNSAQEIANRLKGKYNVLVYSKHNSLEAEDTVALAILSKQMPKEVSHLTLGSKEQRIALRATFRFGLKEVDVINTHLFWYPYNLMRTFIQRDQVKRIIQWSSSSRPTIICGDMNAVPKSRPIIEFSKRGFVSSYKNANGSEPKWTCANPVPSPERSTKDNLLLALYNLLRFHRFGVWRGVYDYIFINKYLKPKKAGVFGKEPAENDSTLYPSDHLGVYADISIKLGARK